MADTNRCGLCGFRDVEPRFSTHLVKVHGITRTPDDRPAPDPQRDAREVAHLIMGVLSNGCIAAIEPGLEDTMNRRLEDASVFVARAWLSAVWLIAGVGAVAILLPTWALSGFLRRRPR